MKRKVFFQCLLLGFLVLITICGVRADVPPPPVNQLVGVYDTEFVDPTELDCRACHGINLADRHHVQGQTTGQTCTDCHQTVWNDSCDCYVFDEFRNCLSCHLYDPSAWPAVPHHDTQDARERHCSKCHGSLVEDYDDDHYVPDYDISQITPDPVCKTWNGPTCVSGGCAACHTEDLSAVPVINGYSDLHHSINLNCVVCHSVHGAIRNCESCHGPSSLHNIQSDSDNPDNPGIIIPGEENLGWGHIGNGWDCFGCHESFPVLPTTSQLFYAASATPQTFATIPVISDLSDTSFTVGQTGSLYISGEGFINISDETTLVSHAQLNNSVNTIPLDTITLSATEMVVTVPATLEPDNYDLQVVKELSISNAVNISVVPGLRINYAICRGTSITIKGIGFSEYVEAENSGTELSAENLLRNQVTCTIRSWGDTKITATCTECPSTVTVKSVWGESVKRTRKLRSRR